MSKFSLKDILELVGIGAVVASLVFVGLEIQQNSSIARLEARQRIQDQEMEIGFTVVNNQELARLLPLAISGQYKVEGLSQQENVTLLMFFFSVLQMMETQYQSVEEGILPEDELGNFGGFVTTNPFVSENWGILRNLFPEGFVTIMENTDNFMEQ